MTYYTRIDYFSTQDNSKFGIQWINGYILKNLCMFIQRKHEKIQKIGICWYNEKNTAFFYKGE